MDGPTRIKYFFDTFEVLANLTILTCSFATTLATLPPASVLTPFLSLALLCHTQVWVLGKAFRIPISNGPGGWTETTYLAAGLRIQRNSRGDSLVLERLQD